jgi:hypothetical protein
VQTLSPPALSQSTKAWALRDEPLSEVPLSDLPSSPILSLVMKGSPVRIRAPGRVERRTRSAGFRTDPRRVWQALESGFRHKEDAHEKAGVSAGPGRCAPVFLSSVDLPSTDENRRVWGPAVGRSFLPGSCRAFPRNRPESLPPTCALHHFYRRDPCKRLLDPAAAKWAGRPVGGSSKEAKCGDC